MDFFKWFFAVVMTAVLAAIGYFVFSRFGVAWTLVYAIGLAFVAVFIFLISLVCALGDLFTSTFPFNLLDKICK